MKNLITPSVLFSLAVSLQALPVYDNFSTYGPSGTLLGGNTSPSGESWILYMNETVGNLVANSNVYVTNYFTVSGSADTHAPNVPSGFPGPLVSGSDTSANSIWTPGYLLANSPQGGVGACLQFASSVANVSGNRVFVSFFVDIPLVYSSGPQGLGDTYGQGQSEGFGWTAGFLQNTELPSPNSTANQNTIPTIFEKFNARAGSASAPTTWKPGVGYLNSTTTGLASAAAVSPATIHFIVLDYEFNGGSGADEQRIWLDPAAANFGVASQPASSASATPTSVASLANAAGFFSWRIAKTMPPCRRPGLFIIPFASARTGLTSPVACKTLRQSTSLAASDKRRC